MDPPRTRGMASSSDGFDHGSLDSTASASIWKKNPGERDAETRASSDCGHHKKSNRARIRVPVMFDCPLTKIRCMALRPAVHEHGAEDVVGAAVHRDDGGQAGLADQLAVFGYAGVEVEGQCAAFAG